MAPGARTSGPGRAAFALALIAIGIDGVVQHAFVAIWSGVPAGFPARAALAWACAAIALACGAGMLGRRSAVVAARVLLAWLLAWMLFFRLPLVVRAPASSEAWWAWGETAVMIAAAWVVAGARGARVARALFGLGLVPFGIAHFTFLQRTAGMVPAWAPGPHVGWAYFTGGALIAAGVAIALGVRTRLVATLAAVELGLFTVLVWGPVLAAGADASQWNECIDSVALTAAAWVVARS